MRVHHYMHASMIFALLMVLGGQLDFGYRWKIPTGHQLSSNLSCSRNNFHGRWNNVIQTCPKSKRIFRCLIASSHRNNMLHARHSLWKLEQACSNSSFSLCFSSREGRRNSDDNPSSWGYDSLIGCY